MKNETTTIARTLRLLALSMFAIAVLVTTATAAESVKIKVTLDASVGKEPLSGRLLIFMKKDDGKPANAIEPDFMDPNAVFISGTEITNFTSETPAEINADADAFPAAFSTMPAGNYLIFALLDRDHSYTYNGVGAGDIESVVSKISMPQGLVSIDLSKVVAEPKLPMHPSMRLVEFVSPMLSAFWGRPIKMYASVSLPPSYATSSKQTYPTVYKISGYGGTHLGALYDAEQRDKDMRDGKRPEMIQVFLEAHVPLGHSVWADSANNGPWGTALEKEFIPYLEKQFRMDAKPSGRFLTGHSSGGWATLWVMVTHPDFFGGTWSTSPDPVDFRNFTGPDITRDPPQNAYTDANGKEYNLVRDQGKELMTVRQYAQQEHVLGYYGGQFASFNAVFSPKGDDGQPMPLFDVETGRIDPTVQKAWQKYNISKLLIDNWKTLGPKLKGKIHIVVGTADTFHLNEAVQLLETELKKLGSDARIEYVEGRTHFDLYQLNGDPDGLLKRFQWEMYKIARPNAKQPATLK